MKKYHYSWNSKEWKAVGDKTDIADMDWWREYQKWHGSYADFSEFLKRAWEVVRSEWPHAQADRLIAALPLLESGDLSVIDYGVVRFSTTEVTE